MEYMSGLFGGGDLPSDYGNENAPAVRLAPGGQRVIPAPQTSGAYGARWAPASPDQPRFPAPEWTIPGNNEFTMGPQASGPQSPNTGNYAQPAYYGATVAGAGPVCPDPTNPAYAYQLRSDGAVIIVKSPIPAGVGKIVAQGSKGYAEIRAVVDACTQRRPIDPRIAIAALTAAGAIATSLAPAKKGGGGGKKKAAFDASAVAVPAPDATPAASGFPTWVWIGGGVLALLGVGGAIYVATRPSK